MELWANDLELNLVFSKWVSAIPKINLEIIRIPIVDNLTDQFKYPLESSIYIITFFRK